MDTGIEHTGRFSQTTFHGSGYPSPFHLEPSLRRPGSGRVSSAIESDESWNDRPRRAASRSGGERQMLAIGRALRTNPWLFLLGDAAEGLAPVVRREIWAALRQLKTRTGLAILLLDKSPRELAIVVGRAVLVLRGTTVWSGRCQRTPQVLGCKGLRIAPQRSNPSSVECSWRTPTGPTAGTGTCVGLPSCHPILRRAMSRTFVGAVACRAGGTHIGRGPVPDPPVDPLSLSSTDAPDRPSNGNDLTSSRSMGSEPDRRVPVRAVGPRSLDRCHVTRLVSPRRCRKASGPGSCE
jgi:hypothetical protein